MAFARLDGHLPALIVDLGDRQIGACAAEWAESHPEAIDEYRSWHERQFPESSPEPRAPGAGEETPTAEPAPAATDGTDEEAG
jgi:hypothetical protein